MTTDAFDISQAPADQQTAIAAVTEIIGTGARQWFAGPFGQAYTKTVNTVGNPMYVIVDPVGALSIRVQ